MTTPVVAIVGRPNVGKSTLFNKIIGQRKAIVEDLPGTTRDRIYGDVVWREKKFTVIDTGGYDPNPDSDIRKKVREQVNMAIKEADAIIFLVDNKDGVVPVDMEIADLLRRSGKPVIIGANKVDSRNKKLDSLTFFELGLDEPVPISAYHGTGTEDLLDRVVDLFPEASSGQAAEAMMKLAIVGRANVGKSMLLNALVGQDRAIVNEISGTTRDAVDTILNKDGESIMFIDTAGIRRRGRITPGIERYSVMRTLQAIERCDIALLVVDLGEALTSQDTHIAGYIKKDNKSLIVIVNKWDLVVGQTKEELTRRIISELKFFPTMQVLFVSAKTGEGVGNILPAARALYDERMKRVPTAILNDIILNAVESHSPPAVRGKRLKILYATQAEVNPPTFVFFVNDAKLRHFSYDRYLENKIREVFGFAATPLRFRFKSRKKKD
ncbi:MAG: ribosome biogenesis GTPase Der [Dehalococcoidia bacterium]|nr:ribosome biogenesis GTPase Der [Dehalococcoidia bacterium]